MNGAVKYPVVLFDLDGTLADSAPDLAGALNRVRVDEGLPALPLTLLRPYASSGARGMLGAGMQVMPDDPRFVALRDRFLEYYAQALAVHSTLFDGVPAMLQALVASGRRHGVVTNKAARFTGPVLRGLGLDDAAVVVCGDTTPHPKPHPAPLLHAAAALGVMPGDCLYVGDDLRDIEAGRAAGMTTLAARWGYIAPGSPCEAWPADGWLDQPVDLMPWLAAR